MVSVMAWAAWIALTIGVGSGVNAAAEHDVPKLPEPKYTRQSAFKIPFEYAPAPDGQRALEVQLHVQVDDGPWRKVQTVSPKEKFFPFRAAHDGRYGFMPLVKYPGNKLLPQGPPAPQLIAVVDTARPTLDLSAERADGTLRVRWRVSDPNLKPESFKVEYQLVAPGAAWQRVAVDPLSSDAEGDEEQVGETTLVPQGQAPSVAIRAEVADKAGNRTVTERTIELPRPGRNTDGEPLDGVDDGAPPHMAERFPAGEPEERDFAADRAAGREAPERFASRRAAAGARSRSTAGHSASYPDTGLDDDDESDDEVAAPSLRGAAPNDTPPRERATSDSRRRPVAEEVTAPSGRGYPETHVETGEAFQGELLPPADKNAASAPNTADALETAIQQTSDHDSSEKALPPGVQLHLVNKQNFELDYELEDIGSTGVAKVELWMTRDGGQNWSLFGTDDDSRSPVLVDVDGEGIYGFCMVVETGAGVRGKPPQSGELPDIWVGVDLTCPTASFVSTEQTSVDGIDELVICWEAGDDRLAERPVTLSFRPSTVGPWTTIAADLENSGKFTWRIDPRIPDQVYLRLEVQDQAGNVQTVDSPEPVVILRSRPRGRIREVRPKNASAANPKMIQNMR